MDQTTITLDKKTKEDLLNLFTSKQTWDGFFKDMIEIVKEYNEEDDK